MQRQSQPHWTDRRRRSHSRGGTTGPLFAGRIVCLAKAGKERVRGACTFGSWETAQAAARERPDCAPLQVGSSLAPVPRSRANPAEPTRECRRLTCQAPGRCPISGGRSAAAAIFPRSVLPIIVVTTNESSGRGSGDRGPVGSPLARCTASRSVYVQGVSD